MQLDVKTLSEYRFARAKEDMESASIAQVCYLYQIPFIRLR